MSDEREVVRAWVARDRVGATLGAYLTEPTLRDDGNGLYWLSDGWCTDLPIYWFPTLERGECWPVEIRRVV